MPYTTNKPMKSTTLKVLGIAICMTVLVSAASAQKRKSAPKSAPPTPVVSEEVRTGAERTSAELKKITRFVFVLGGVAQGIEDIDSQVRAGGASRATAEQNEQFKQNVIQGIRNLQSGLASLEVEFRTKAGLRPYAAAVDGVTAVAGTAEDLALEGKFKDAGRTLIGAVEKLADALAILP